MVDIIPFNGITYNKEKISDFSRVITPPNDVISKEVKQELIDQSDFNFVKLILPDGNGDKYENSAKLLKEWVQEEVLAKDDEETIYIYSESYIIDGKMFGRTGFMTLIKLEDLGNGVLPHEKILEKDLKDRIELIKTTKANFGVPFVLYDDKQKIIDEIVGKEIEGKEPYINFTDKKNVTHKLWKVSNKKAIMKIQEEMKQYRCVIADGHHRYTSELKVKEMLEDTEGAKYGLLCFVNSFNEGMIILPTNRVVFGLENIDMGEVIEQLNEYFEVEEIGDIEELAKKVSETKIMIDKTTNLKNHVFGVYSNLNNKGYLLSLKDISILDSIMPGKTDIYQKLDINILHKIIIEKILGISEEKQKNRENIDFIKGNEETVAKMQDKEIQFAFFVNPPLMREVFLTARAGETMPQKSTYFYPKVFSGLVIYDMDSI
jgi:uncharacterized protein (DUF1015 family)